MADPQTYQSVATIRNKLGMHARPAMILVEMATKYESRITLKRADGDEKVDAKSIMQVMLLAAGPGTHIEVEGDGPDAKQAVDEIVEYINRGFDED